MGARVGEVLRGSRDVDVMGGAAETGLDHDRELSRELIRGALGVRDRQSQVAEEGPCEPLVGRYLGSLLIGNGGADGSVSL